MTNEELQKRYFAFAFTDDLTQNVQTTYQAYRQTNPELWSHSQAVAKEAVHLAQIFDIDEQAAYSGGLLHDIGGIVPNTERISLAEDLGIPLLPEERAVPMLIHAKFSAYFAEHIYHVDDPGILTAITYHTTLHASATDLEKIVCLADKIKWDAQGTPPYLEELQIALTRSLDAGAAFFIDHLRNDDLLIVHPWLQEAYDFYGAGQF